MGPILAWFMANGLNLLGGISAVFGALLAVALIIPGEQPDKALQGIVDFLKKFSIK